MMSVPILLFSAFHFLGIFPLMDFRITLKTGNGNVQKRKKQGYKMRRGRTYSNPVSK